MYKIKGTIHSIGEKKELANGAVVIDYVVNHVAENGYSTLYNVGMYKKAEYAEHVDNLLKFNKVGDSVELEFTIRSQEHNGRIYNNISHWKLEQMETEPTVKVGEPEADDLPF
tara:strand:+ start:28 stop:366 length:339 start_codon:yes stop_codon:yes gene_type:complete